MSQTRKTLKKIASGEEYGALVTAIEKADYDTIFNGYMKISVLIEEADKEIQQKIQSLARRNKDEDYQKFRSAFALHAKATLPQWYWLNSELEKQKIKEGVVFGFGSKGDPLVRTSEGKVVIISGSILKQGEKVRFRVVTEGEKTDFGRVFELTPQSFYVILSQKLRETVMESLNLVKERLDSHSEDIDEDSLSELENLLRKLEENRELATKLQAEERERTVARVLAYRKRLLKVTIIKLALDFLSRQEEREIGDACQGDKQKLAIALSAPGLFRYQAHESVKTELMSGEQPKGYAEILEKLEKNLDSMHSALELLEFKAAMNEVYPVAKRYLSKLDRLFERITERARQLAFTLAEGKICSMEDIDSAIKNAFSGETVSSDIRNVFRSAGEYFTLRGALMQLKARLGYAESTSAEAALRPYLRQKIALAFGDNP